MLVAHRDGRTSVCPPVVPSWTCLPKRALSSLAYSSRFFLAVRYPEIKHEAEAYAGSDLRHGKDKIRPRAATQSMPMSSMYAALSRARCATS